MYQNRRILVVDDNMSIHQDIDSILLPEKESDTQLKELETSLFGDRTPSPQDEISYDIDHAYQGDEAVEMVESAAKESKPYAAIFMDVRMPSGIDGIQATKKIWHDFPDTEVIICTAYSDYSWDEILKNLGVTDHLLFLKKPFDSTSVKQMALSLTTKWSLQQESLRYTEKLEHEVEKRTKELESTVTELKVLKEIAEEASHAKSEFLANVSHEIRTPMNGIVGMNALLMETELDEEQLEYAKMVEFSSDSLLHIINDILDFSKIEAGKMDLESIAFSPEETVSKLAKLLEVSDKNKKVSVIQEFDQSIPAQLIGDPSKIHQILLNYGNNAIKFTDEGEVKISAVLEEENEDSVQLLFQVKDSGIGMAESFLPNLFKPFSQEDSSTSRKYGGTGLGLAICKKIATLMDGNVGVDTKLGEGSTFWFRVQLNKNDQNIGEAQTHDAKPIEFKEQSKSKVLLVEDNAVNRLSIQRILEKSGCEVYMASNGLEAIKEVEHQNFDIIFMDLNMPKMDGIEATKKIRLMEEGTGYKVPIIAWTANVTESARLKCKEAGMVDFLTKPTTIDSIKEKIDQWVSNQPLVKS